MRSGYSAWAARWRVPIGYALGIAFVILSQPTARLLVTGGGIAVLGLFLRAIASGYLDKGHALATSGPYRYTRNPLYLGSSLMGLGFAIAAASWPLGLAFAVFFAVIYLPVMRREENDLQRQYGDEYDQYTRTVPLFFPTLAAKSTAEPSPAAAEKFRWERYQNNREYEATVGYFIGLIFLAAKLYWR
jgi:protein-S-isoprenylcysteine O-methyltransferase Ste14